MPSTRIQVLSQSWCLAKASPPTVGYTTIRQLLLGAGYEEGPHPYVFFKKVRVRGRTLDVQVDLLAGEYEGTGRRRRTQKVQDVRARKARGCDLAFEMYSTIEIKGVLPDGGVDSALVRTADIVAFLAMKGMAMHDRLKAKDAWDVYFCVKNFPNGPNALVDELSRGKKRGLVREGFQKIADKFSSPDHVGPKSVADFEEVTDAEERARLRRDAYERVDYVLRKLGFTDG